MYIKGKPRVEDKRSAASSPIKKKKQKLSAVKQFQAEEEYFNVEKILDKRKLGNKCEYLVKWENYPESDATWEPLANLRNVKDMVKEFNAELEKKKQLSELENLYDMSNLQSASTNVSLEAVPPKKIFGISSASKQIKK